MLSTMRTSEFATASASRHQPSKNFPGNSAKGHPRHVMFCKQQNGYDTCSRNDYIIPGYKQWTLSQRAGITTGRSSDGTDGIANRMAQNHAALALMTTAKRGWMLATAASIESVDFVDVSIDSIGLTPSGGRNQYEKYEAALAEARENFMGDSGLEGFFQHLGTLERPAAQKLLASFLLVFTAVGSRMTAPVQSWIERAGEACIAKGFTAVGKELKMHAVGEAGHDKWYVNDARAIASFMQSELGIEGVDADQLMAQEVPEPVKLYDALHENVINSAAPFCQLAIENEIELLSLLIGKPFMQNIMEYLGSDFSKKCMTFVGRHVVADEEHTVENEEMLLELLAQHPDTTEQLVAVGKSSLQVYASHLRHCMAEGYKLANIHLPL